MPNRLLKVGLALCVLLGPSGCRDKGEVLTFAVSGQTMSVEVARTAADREHGLMGRTDLGPRTGMIFLFDRDQHLTFWMKDTPTALSIAFISTEGRIQEIDDMEPFSEKLIISRLSARYALEMRKGAFAELGIREGDVLQFPQGFPGTARIEP
jgi:uncharacterized membrane protein (UPF0127 family)